MIDVIINHLENQKLPTPGSKLFWVVTSPPPYPIREHAHKSQRPGKETEHLAALFYIQYLLCLEFTPFFLECGH